MHVFAIESQVPPAAPQSFVIVTSSISKS